MRTGRLLAALLALGSAMAPGTSTARAQQDEFADTVDVTVINVDAVVTGPDGRSIRGLSAEDFELRVGGRPVPIDYFARVEGGRLKSGGDPASQPAVYRPYLVIVYDRTAFRPREARRLFETLRQRMPAIAAACRGVLIAGLDRTLEAAETFTSDPARLQAELELLENAAPPGPRSDRIFLMRNIEQSPRVGDAQSFDERQRAQQRARSLLGEIQGQAQLEVFETRAKIEQLRRLVRSIAGLPGRKSVLFLGRGLQTMPAEPLFRAWWSRYSDIAPEIGVGSIESQFDSPVLRNEMQVLIAEANRGRVTFYAHDPGLRTTGGNLELETPEAAGTGDREALSRQQNLVGLAHGTGGLALANSSELDSLLEAMREDFDSYYSLGYVPDGEPAGAIAVRVRHTGYRVRQFGPIALEREADRLEAAAMTALMTDSVRNPLRMSVELSGTTPQLDGTVLVSLLVKVPIGRLSLLPRAEHHIGRVSVVAVAQNAAGDVSLPVHGKAPVEIANEELLAAMGRVAGYRVELRVASGEQKIAIGLRDDIAGELSTLSLVVDPRRDS